MPECKQEVTQVVFLIQMAEKSIKFTSISFCYIFQAVKMRMHPELIAIVAGASNQVVERYSFYFSMHFQRWVVDVYVTVFQKFNW